jgi:hypothetical protein
VLDDLSTGGAANLAVGARDRALLARWPGDAARMRRSVDELVDVVDRLSCTWPRASACAASRSDPVAR